MNNKLQLSRIAEQIPDFYVLKIDALANELIKKGKKIIKLNLGKSELPMPDYVTKEVIGKINDKKKRETINPQGLIELRNEIIEDYNNLYDLSLSRDQVFTNNGTSPFFLQLYLLLMNSGDEALFPKPYYPTYIANANIARIKKRFYRIQNGRINLDDIRKNFKPGKTKMVLINSPGNPLGNVATDKELKEILRIVKGGAYIISDEIYDGFVYKNNYTSILGVYNPRRDKVVVLNGFSKIHHMYTRRLGFAIVPKQLIGPMLRFQQHNLVCVDPVTQYAGLVSLKNKKKLIRNEVKKEVKIYESRLNKCREIIKTTKLKIFEPEGSFYMCVNVSVYTNGKKGGSLALAEELLKKTGVAVTPAEDFGMDSFFRISLTSNKVIGGVRKLCDFLNRKTI